MQWLIDLVIETIGVPPCYIDRGNVGGWDFALGDFTIDGAFHDLDLSGIIPAGATAVLLHLSINCDNIGGSVNMRTSGGTVFAQRFRLVPQVAGIHNMADGVLGLIADRKIKYSILIFNYTAISLRVKGWWL